MDDQLEAFEEASVSLEMSEVLGLQTLPESGGGIGQAAYTGVGSYISIWGDCAGRWSVTCIPF